MVKPWQNISTVFLQISQTGSIFVLFQIPTTSLQTTYVVYNTNYQTHFCWADSEIKCPFSGTQNHH